MIFWILAIGLSVITVLLMLRPLLAKSVDADVSHSSGYDSEVYKDQLREIERDLEAGTLSEKEAELARVEISRRLIASSEMDNAAKSGKAFSAISVAPLALLFVVLSAFLYVLVGNPTIPNQPLALREAPNPAARLALRQEQDGIADMVAQAEAHLAKNPNDGRGWDVLAPIYFRMGEYLKSQQAFAKAIELEGSTPIRHSGLGEAIMRAQEGLVTPEARSNFERSLELDSNDPRANFFLALALMQDGKNNEAITAFEDFARRSPADAPWVEAIRAQIATMKGVSLSDVKIETAQSSQSEARTNVQTAPLGNPSAEDIEAAAEMSSQDRMQMIASMVESLNEKLKDEPNNFEGWLRLIRSFKVIGRDNEAIKAVESALNAFPSDTDQGKAIIDMAEQLQIELPDGVSQ